MDSKCIFFSLFNLILFKCLLILHSQLFYRVIIFLHARVKKNKKIIAGYTIIALVHIELHGGTRRAVTDILELPASPPWVTLSIGQLLEQGVLSWASRSILVFVPLQITRRGLVVALEARLP